MYSGTKLAKYYISERGITSSALFHYFQIGFQNYLKKCLAGQLCR